MYIIFDLGGVLIKFPGIKKFLKWMGSKADENSFKEKWLLSQTVKKFESGKTDENEFTEDIIKEFEFRVTKEKFLKKMSIFREGPFTGVNNLLKKLAKKHELGILSNTNKLHWEIFQKKFKFLNFIKYKFLSFEIGKIKPDEKIYKYVIEKLRCKPEEIIYFDDSIININAAKRIGIKSYNVNGFTELKKTIKNLFF